MLMTAMHAAAVEDLPWHHRDPFDRLLVAQASIEQCALVTADRRLAGIRSRRSGDADLAASAAGAGRDPFTALPFRPLKVPNGFAGSNPAPLLIARDRRRASPARGSPSIAPVAISGPSAERVLRCAAVEAAVVARHASSLLAAANSVAPRVTARGRTPRQLSRPGAAVPFDGWGPQDE